MIVLLAFFCVLHPFPSVAKKLGGKLEVVSFDDDLEGGLLFFPENEHILGWTVCVHLTECVFLYSWRNAPSCSYRSLCIRNWSDICGSELESSCLFQQGSHVVLHWKGTVCFAWMHRLLIFLDWRRNASSAIAVELAFLETWSWKF